MKGWKENYVWLWKTGEENEKEDEITRRGLTEAVCYYVRVCMCLCVFVSASSRRHSAVQAAECL